MGVLDQAPGRAVGSREVHCCCCLDEGDGLGGTGDTNRNPVALHRRAPAQHQSSQPGEGALASLPLCHTHTHAPTHTTHSATWARLIALALFFFSSSCPAALFLPHAAVPTCAAATDGRGVGAGQSLFFLRRHGQQQQQQGAR